MVDFFFFFLNKQFRVKEFGVVGKEENMLPSEYPYVAKSLTMPLIANPFKEILEEICYI